MQNPFGKIQTTPLRDIWSLETSFSRWLAEPENLQRLSDEIGIEMELVQLEARVGDFSTDILAQQVGTADKVIIENQLENTNHDHLGKLITYASGHDAKIVVWIFKDIREEHRQAIDWLNEKTTQELAFFAVTLKIIKIDDSKPAIIFDVVCKPNEWTKSMRGPTGYRNSEHTEKLLSFWAGLHEYASEQRSGIRLQNPTPQHWTSISIGTSIAHISIVANSKNKHVKCELTIPDNTELFSFLEKRKTEIENSLGGNVLWDESRDGRKKTLIAQVLGGFNIESTSDYPKYFAWYLKKIELFQKTFKPLLAEYLKSLQ